MEISPSSMYNKGVILFLEYVPETTGCNGPQVQIISAISVFIRYTRDLHEQEKRQMLQSECKIKLKHQLEIGRRLQQLGLYAAATESRNRARVLLQIYKRHFRKQVVNRH
jgi:hypothetical protein